MGCCSSRIPVEANDGSPKYTETGAEGLHFANSHIQVHACAAGFFRRTSVAQLICLDVSDTYILVGIGDAVNAAVLAPRMQSLPQVFSKHLASLRQGSDALTETCHNMASQVAGSSLALLHIDQRTFKLTMACCGGANAVLGELVHGLAAQVAEASLLCPQTEVDPHGQVDACAGTPAGQEGATTAATEKSSGAQQQHVHVVERQLLPVHEHIIVGLPGLWAVTSPDSAALRAHFFLRGMSGTHSFGDDGQTPCQTAGHLARFAEGQARVHTNTIGVMVITLRWPSSSVNQAFSDQGLRQALRGGNLPAANAGAQDSPSQRARRHWRLVQSLYVEYVRAHRRVVRGKWHKVIKLAVAEGVKRAHKLEEEIWLREGLVVSVSPSMKIRNQKGQEISVAARSTRLDLQE